MADRNSVFSLRLESNQSTKEEKATVAVWKQFLQNNRSFLPRVALILIFSVIGSVALVRIPYYFRAVIDLFVSSLISSFIKGEPALDGETLLPLLVPVVVVILLATVFSYLRDVFCSSLSSSLADRYRRSMFKKFGLLRMSFVDDYTKPSLLRVATESIDAVNQGVNLLFSKAISSLILMIALLVTVLRMNLTMGLILLAAFPLQLLGQALITRAEKTGGKKASTAPDLPDIAEWYENLDVLQLSAEAEMLAQRSDEQEASTAGFVARARFLSFARQHLTGFLSALTMVAVLLCSVDAIRDGDASLGLLLSMIIYVRRMEAPLTQLVLIRTTFNGLSTAVKKLYDVNNAPEEDVNGPTPLASLPDDVVAFRNVSFRYADSPSTVLPSFSFKLPPQGVTVLFGPSGSGKTTLIKLLLGLYTPQDGEIVCGGCPLTQLNCYEYRSLFTLVSQESTLFDVSVTQNIVYPDLSVDSDRLNLVVESLKLNEAFMVAPNIRETAVRTLSQGQIQLVLLARALYHNSRYIILDESFSHLDAAFEEQLVQILAGLAETHGIIVISHRPSVLRHADRVLRFPLPIDAQAARDSGVARI